MKIRFPRIVVLFLFCFITGNIISQNVIETSDPSITTDTLRSGSLVMGINSNGGGVINYLSIPGPGNIFGPQSVKYGRSGQSAMRDALHGGRYNPTQAGFNETCGTPIVIEKYEDKLIIPARHVALWYGDCKWDFAEWENICADPDCYDDNGYGDQDELDEYNLPGKQNTEVRSEFDYYGKYHDYKGKGGIETACIRHYFEYRYFRPPGHCINQFRPGLDIYKSAFIHPDISEKFPAGNHKAEPFDMSNFILSWHMRHDIEKWNPGYNFVKDPSGDWIINTRGTYIKETLNDQGENEWPNLLIVSDSDNPDTDNALGFYLPDSEFNRDETVGVNQTTGQIEYKDNRYQSIRIWDQRYRIPTMSVYGFKTATNGILNRNRLPQDVYEAYRYDMFILMGSPNEIWETIQKIESQKTTWYFNENLEGWTGTPGIEYSSADSSVSLQMNDVEEGIYSPDSLLIDTDLHKYLTLRIRNQTTSTNLEFSFLKYDDPLRYKQVLDIQPESDHWQFITLNISDHPDWKGMIRNMEVRIPASSGKVDFDLIAISADGLIDCHGIFQGSAYLDACGNCVGGTTGQESCEDCMGVAYGEAYLNDCGDCLGGSSPFRNYDEWNFDSLNNWVLNPRLEGAAMDGKAKLTVTGDDPYMNFEGTVCLNTNEYQYLRVKIQNNTNGNAATFYYQNDVTNYWRLISFAVSTYDSEFKTYDVYLGNLDDWEGNVHKIRFDPPGSSGNIDIDYIGILTEEMYANNPQNIEMKSNRQDHVLIYPNPSSDNFYVKLLSGDQAIIRIKNLAGQIIKEDIIYKNSNNIFSLSEYKEGVYIIEILCQEKKINRKIIKI